MQKNKEFLKLFESHIYEIIDSKITIDIDKKITKKIFNLTENEFDLFSKFIYSSSKFTDTIKNIFNLDNLNKKKTFFNLDLYQLLGLENNILSNAIKISFKTYFNYLKNTTQYIFFEDTDIDKIKKNIGYYILLNSNTKKIYDKYYYINNIKKKICFLSAYKNICNNTNFTFGCDYNSDDFIKTIKLIFFSVEKKNNILNKYNNKKDFNLKNFNSEYIFDDEYKTKILDKKLDEFIDLYKLFELNIDMSQTEIEEKFYLEEEKINLLNDIEKYVGYNILLNKKTRKIYDNYYLNYYIENWDKISFEFSEKYLTDKKNSNEILSQINFVYSNLYNSNTTISDEKLNSNQIISLIDNYNKKCEDFVIKDDKNKKTPEELDKMYIDMVNKTNLNNVVNILSTHELNETLETCIDERNTFLNSLYCYTDNDKEINKIILFYTDHKIIYNELIDYRRYQINQNSNTLTKINDKFDSSYAEIKSYHTLTENMAMEIPTINFEDFNIVDFNLYRTTINKLKEKIIDSDYFDYLEDRKINNNKLEKMYKNNLDLVEYYFNQIK